MTAFWNDLILTVTSPIATAAELLRAYDEFDVHALIWVKCGGTPDPDWYRDAEFRYIQAQRFMTFLSPWASIGSLA